ncbi:MAG: hypothetical protein AMXMBFR33_31930 [Candidatus Xenobia bacterium]
MANSIVDLYLERYPFRGARDGLYELQGQVGDWSPSSLDAYCRALSEQAPQGASHDEALQRMAAESERFWYQDLGWHTISPMVYLEAVDPGLYLTRDNATPQERGKMAAQHAAQVPRLLHQAKLNLTGPSSAATLRQGAASAREYVPVYQDEIPKAFPQAEKVALAAAAALEGWGAWLEERSAVAPDHLPMGERLFQRMLQTGPGLELTPSQLEQLALHELERNLEQAHLIRSGAQAQHASMDDVLEEVRQIVSGLRDFLHENQVVSLPDEFACVVRNSPPGARWSFASMDNPGLFEEERQAFFNVTLPDPAWSQKEQDDWMCQFDHAMLHLIALHESFPGHFVHALHMARSPSRARKLLRNYAFTEGWAHYCEEMMVDTGYQLPDPASLRSNQVLAALDRTCRLLASLRLHCAGDELSAVARLFEQSAYMQPGRALASARRGSFDPEYGYYTLGKMIIKQLRSDLCLPAQEFHDKILSYGSPPPALLRRTLGLPGSPL